MSFDVHFQGFLDGQATPRGGGLMREVLKPYIAGEEPEHTFLRIEIGGGSADVYLNEADMMANHISSDQPWDLLVRGARAADWVIMPVGCSTCITNEVQRAHLPDELRDDVALVMSGSELLGVIRAS